MSSRILESQSDFCFIDAGKGASGREREKGIKFEGIREKGGDEVTQALSHEPSSKSFDIPDGFPDKHQVSFNIMQLQ